MSAARQIRPPESPATFPVDEFMVVCAFRYALGCTSTAPGHVASQLRTHWAQLNEWSRAQIHRDIENAIARGEAGHPCDVDTWREILALPTNQLGATKRCEGCGRSWYVCVCSHDDADDGCGGGVEYNSHS